MEIHKLFQLDNLPLIIIIIIITLIRLIFVEKLFKIVGIYGTNIFEVNFIKRSVLDAILSGITVLTLPTLELFY